MGKLAGKWYNLCFNKHKCIVSDENKGVILKTKISVNCLFPMHINYSNDMYCNFTSVVDSWLWPLGLRHLNIGSIKFVSNKEWSTSVPLIQVLDKLCEHYVLWKKHMDSFSTK